MAGYTSELLTQLTHYTENADLINPLFTTCLSVAGNDSKDAKIKKSLMAGYTSELLTQLIHYPENA